MDFGEHLLPAGASRLPSEHFHRPGKRQAGLDHQRQIFHKKQPLLAADPGFFGKDFHISESDSRLIKTNFRTRRANEAAPAVRDSADEHCLAPPLLPPNMITRARCADDANFSPIKRGKVFARRSSRCLRQRWRTLDDYGRGSPARSPGKAGRAEFASKKGECLASLYPYNTLNTSSKVVLPSNTLAIPSSAMVTMPPLRAISPSSTAVPWRRMAPRTSGGFRRSSWMPTRPRNPVIPQTLQPLPRKSFLGGRSRPTTRKTPSGLAPTCSAMALKSAAWSGASSRQRSQTVRTSRWASTEFTVEATR